VACGASAGGLEPFSQLLAALPTELGAAIVLVQHLAPEHESMLATLLQHHTPMPVREVREQAQIECNRVYVAPPGMFLEMHDGSLALVPRTTDAVFHPIDHFFRSVAEHSGERSI